MQALDRLITILEEVAGRGRAAGPAEVAQAMDLPMSTVARLMRQLADAGMLYRSPVDGRYALGSRIFALASAGASHVDLAEVALPVMRELRDASGETVSLHVLRGTQRVCIAEVQSTHQVRRVVPPGMAQDLCGTATGEVLLADAPQPEVDAAVRYARFGAAERRALAARLDDIRARGYAIEDHAVDGLTGMSAPVREGRRTVAALSVSGPTQRFDRSAAERHSGTLLAATARLSAA